MFENSFLPRPGGKPLNCQKCDEDILTRELAAVVKAKDKKQEKEILRQILLVRKR